MKIMKLLITFFSIKDQEGDQDEEEEENEKR